MFQSIVALNDGKSPGNIGVGVAGRLAELCRCPLEIAVLEPELTEDLDEEVLEASAVGRSDFSRIGRSRREYRVSRDTPSGLAGFLESHRRDLLVHVAEPARDAIEISEDPLFQYRVGSILLFQAVDASEILGKRWQRPKILVALDQSVAHDQELLQPAIDLARATGGHLTLVTVVARNPVAKAPEISRARPRQPFQKPAVDRYLDHVADTLRVEGISVACRVIESPFPASALLDLLEGGRYDFAVVGTGGSTHRPGLGGVATEIVRRSVKPLLIVGTP